jgi:glutathione S-transferase
MTKSILYSFRRCPYAIRARIALISHDIDFELREVDLKNKPAHMLELSPKGTVPVLLLKDGQVIDESLDILDYVLDYKYDEKTEQLISDLHTTFIPTLRRFKYPERYEDTNLNHEKDIITKYLTSLDVLLAGSVYLTSDIRAKADIAILPFVRQLHRANETWFESVELEHLKRWYFAFYNSDLHQRVMEKL